MTTIYYCQGGKMKKVIDIFKAVVIFSVLIGLSIIISKFDPENPHKFTENTPLETDMEF